jgi:hypothetical protein
VKLNSPNATKILSTFPEVLHAKSDIANRIAIHIWNLTLPERQKGKLNRHIEFHYLPTNV